MKNEEIQKPVVSYSITDAALAALEEKYADVPDTSTKEGYDAAKAALKELTPLRTGIEKRRKELKADALDYGRRVDAAAKEITDRLLAIESPIKEAKRRIDDEAKRIKEERENRIRAKIEAFSAYPQTAFGQPSEVIAEMIEDMEAVDIDDFYEFSADAGAAKMRTLKTLGEMFTAAVNQEIEAERLAVEREQHRIQMEEIERQRAEAAAQQAELDRQRAEMEAQQAEIERQRAEMEAQLVEAERLKAEAEAKRIESEQRQDEAELAAAESPDPEPGVIDHHPADQAEPYQQAESYAFDGGARPDILGWGDDSIAQTPDPVDLSEEAQQAELWLISSGLSVEWARFIAQSIESGDIPHVAIVH